MTRAAAWILLIVALWARTARASDPSDGGFRRATALAWAGGATSIVGMPLMLGGGLMTKAGPSYTPAGEYAFGMTLYVGGYVAMGTGGALMAGGSLAARRVLVRRGVRITAVPGALAWATWGLTVGSSIVLPWFGDVPGAAVIALGSYVATIGLGTTQILLNQRAFRRRPADAASDHVRFAMAVAPSVGRDRVGVSLVASF